MIMEIYHASSRNGPIDAWNRSWMACLFSPCIIGIYGSVGS